VRVPVGAEEAVHGLAGLVGLRNDACQVVQRGRRGPRLREQRALQRLEDPPAHLRGLVPDAVQEVGRKPDEPRSACVHGGADHPESGLADGRGVILEARPHGCPELLRVLRREGKPAIEESA